ncbi:6-phosphogluconolactonase [Pleurocapsa sp. FMAR1]|uniref:6-phosphogluconolactonase n=1 Tax=Pleurocapsa sp. FMAR1 TaxID=3040204 RepID=UPI0029C7E1D2|nr:6-phosphogluconolactonase [Pleurocapsa sp. FMAR1]
MNRIVEVLADKTDLIKRSQEILLSRLQAAIEARNQFTIALAGGSTPKPLYESLASQPLPWSKIHFFWGDERYVPASHNDSNQLMTRQALLDRIDIPQGNIHPMDTTVADPLEAAQKHEQDLQEFFGVKQTEMPKFDLILLGMGDDGHTASLFPKTEALSVSDRLITVGNKDGQPRLTFTVPLINQARCVVFLVAGENKRSALKEVFASQGDAQNYPSRLIQPQGELIWLLDRQAAAEL